jgi:AcrR family transcriptional regulator
MRAQIRKTSKSRQRQIVETTRKIIATRGMEALTIREIAKGVGISEGDIYRHFVSKKQILLLLIDDIERTLLEAVKWAASEKQNPVESLENVLKAHLSYAEQRRGVSAIVIAESLRLADKDLREKMFEVVNRYIARIEALLALGVKSGQVRKNIDLRTAALTFFAMVHANVILWSLSDSRFSLAKRHKPLWELYLSGIAMKTSDMKS